MARRLSARRGRDPAADFHWQTRLDAREVLSMPAPRWMAQFNRQVTNRLLGSLATRLPGMGVVVHTGRKTRREYRTPVLVFAHGDYYVIALTYGPDTDWVRNVLANGGCRLEMQGRTIHLTQPRLFHDKRRQAVPLLIRLMLGVGNVSDFLEFRRDEEAATGQDGQ